MSKNATVEMVIPEVRFGTELKGERGEKMLKAFKVARKTNPMLTFRQFTLSLLDKGLEN